jgi:hypothetical protein
LAVFLFDRVVNILILMQKWAQTPPAGYGQTAANFEMNRKYGSNIGNIEALQ